MTSCVRRLPPARRVQPWASIVRRRPWMSSPWMARPASTILKPLSSRGLWLPVTWMPLEHKVVAAKYSMGVVAMPMSITSTPAATSPRIRAAANAGPDRRPSRPTATTRSPCARAWVPKARPSASATSSFRVTGVVPRMS